MRIARFLEESLKDYDGKIASVIFTQGCNYRCPSCHSKHIVQGKTAIDEDEVIRYFDRRGSWIDGIVICGGEPTIHHTLLDFLEKVRRHHPKISIKLDTNGSDWRMLGEIYENKLADYVAMDIKGPFGLYAKLTGKEMIDERDGITKAMAVTSRFFGHEFRTTVVPIERGDGKMSFMTPEEVGEAAKFVYDNLPNNDSPYYLQKFVARDESEMLEERFAKERLARELHTTPDNLMQEALGEARRYLPNSKIR